jgi:hypothetical protein
VEHPLNRGPVDHRFAILEVVLEILTQAPAAAEPRDCPFHNPSAREDDKTLLSGRALHNCQRDSEQRCCPFDQFAGIALVGPAIRDRRTQNAL